MSTETNLIQSGPERSFTVILISRDGAVSGRYLRADEPLVAVAIVDEVVASPISFLTDLNSFCVEV